MRILARREHSVSQLKRKLGQRGHSDQTSGEVIESLADSGLQSDTRFAETLARSRASQGYGPQRIRAELKEARIPDAEIRAAFEALECDFAQRAIEVRERKFGAMPAERGADSHKQYRFLASRGFESDQIRAALKGEPDE